MLWLLGGSRRPLAGWATAGAASAPPVAGGPGSDWGLCRDLGESVGGRPDRRLRLALTGPGFDCQRWLWELADRLGVVVVVTDDSSDYAGPVAAAAGLGSSETRLGAVKKRLSTDCREQYPGRLDRARELIQDRPEDGAEQFHQWARDPSLPPELRRLAALFREPWRQMLRRLKEPGLPNSANGLAGKFGWIKPR